MFCQASYNEVPLANLAILDDVASCILDGPRGLVHLFPASLAPLGRENKFVLNEMRLSIVLYVLYNVQRRNGECQRHTQIQSRTPAGSQ
jgi:hypothetical protein